MTALREQWQQAREQRQAELQQRRQNLMNQLAEITTQRQESAIATAAKLRKYVITLQSQVHQTRLHNQQDLAEMQSDVLAMAADVQAALIELQQDRHNWSADLMKTLAVDAEALRRTVAHFLDETGQIRQEQATELHTQLKADRQTQVAEVAAFRQSLQTSLEALKVFRQQLHASVWGESATRPPTAQPKSSQPAQAGSPHRAPSQPTVSQPTVSQPTVSQPTVNQPTAKAKATALKALKNPLSNIEQTILEHLKTTEGLKVIEIEQALRLQRLQTIDALRILQQRGLVMQKDRLYRTVQAH